MTVVIHESCTDVLIEDSLYDVGADCIAIENCTFRRVESSEVVARAGSISFRNLTIEPAKKTRSLNSPESKP